MEETKRQPPISHVHVIFAEREGGGIVVSRLKISGSGLVYSIPKDKKIVRTVESVTPIVEMVLKTEQSVAILAKPTGYTISSVIAVSNHDKWDGGIVGTYDSVSELREKVEDLLGEWVEFNESQEQDKALRLRENMVDTQNPM